MTKTLSKSDFKIASTCAKKLEYKKSGYPTSMDENEFMKMLAEGGYIVGKLATILNPGIEISGTTDEALSQTKKLLEQENVTLHEAAIKSGQKIIRIDILKKAGNHFELIEVKAKSFNGDGEKEEEKKNMEAYIEDVVFQTLVLQEAFPDSTIDSKLLMPDKSKRTTIEGLASWFKVRPQEEADFESGRFKKVVVDFIEKEGTVAYEAKKQIMLDDHLLEILDLNAKVLELTPVIRNRTNQFLKIMNSEYKYEKTDFEIDKKCKTCEYRASDSNPKDGFKECWGEMAVVDPHVFDLYYGGTVGDRDDLTINRLIKKGKVNLFDFKEDDFVTKDGDVGSRNERQLIQYRNTRENLEWYSDSMEAALSEWKYPLHFIDFETYAGAIPFHNNMRPYETVAFQWSCHTIHSPGAEPVHSEWINTEPSFPNFKFAETLMDQIGSTGTPLMWATHENTVLRSIYKQMDIRNYENEKLKNWLYDITKDKKANGIPAREGRLIDMNAFTLKHYFHPYMKGRTSIKKTLPAAWNHNTALHTIPWFKKYFKLDEVGNVSDPYLTLKYIFNADSIESSIAEKEIDDVVKEGGAAMKAYNDMMYGDKANKENLKNQLLEYCKLDTLAMVIIWTHWNHLVSKK